MRRLIPPSLAVCVLLLVQARPAGAGVVLHEGDIVMVDTFYQPYPPTYSGVWRVDPATLDTTLITIGGLLVRPDHVAVDGAGIIYVTDRVAGVVAIDPSTRAQSQLLSPAALGGRTARGICVASDSTLVITTTGSNLGMVLEVVPRTGEVSVLAQGDLLVSPACVAQGPGGELYVGDETANTSGDATAAGSIVRIQPGGAQSVFANGSLFHHPFDIAISGDGWVWTAQWGWVSRRSGGFLRTRLADGMTEYVPSDRSQGIAVTRDDVLLGDCISISLDCYAGYRHLHRPFSYDFHYLPAGAMAVVPAITTPTRRATWGALKTLYR